MFAAPLSALYAHAKALGLPESGDPTLDCVLYLSMAHGAIERLKELGVDTTLNAQPLVVPAVVRAYREVVHIRSRVNNDWLDTDAYSRYGRLYSEERHAKKLSNPYKRRTNRNTNNKNKTK